VVIGEPLAGDIQGEIVSRAAHSPLSLSRRRSIRGGARDQRCELEVIAAIERQVLDTAVLDYRPDICGFGLQHWGASRHLYHLGNVSELERDINARHLRHLQLDIAADLGAKT